jgi:hypothetical protein
MGLHIENDQLEADLHALAAREGKGLTETLQKLVSEELRRTPPAPPARSSESEIQRRVAELERIQREFAALPILDPRSAKEILDDINDDVFIDLERRGRAK